MDFYLTHHAEQELERREIPRDFLDRVLQSPQQIVNERDGRASVIVSVSFGHSRNSSFELNALKPCPAWMTPY